MRQLLLVTNAVVGQQIILSGDDSHYLITVLRLGVGESLTVVDSGGRRFTAVVDRSADTGVTLTIQSELETGNTGPKITVFQAIPKARKFDDVIRQCVQAGASAIVPIITERSVVRGDSASKTERWLRVAREAVQQSGALPVEISRPRPVTDICAQTGALSLVLHTKPIAQQSLHGYLDRVPGQLELVVGPEGGFTTNEIRFLTEHGFHGCYLGPLVLRSETAAVFALGAIQVLLQERDKWRPAD